MASPFAGGTMYLENNYAFLQQAGQWYLDSATGQLFYKAASGQNPSSLDIELPRMQTLVQVSGSYSSPVTGLSFSNVTFTGTTWLGPSGPNGYADQQNGAFITGTWQRPPFGSCFSGCQLFEATREAWDQMPAAVQVSAATGITFSGDTFTDLGEVGLGIGQDADANASGTGLGASNITITGNTFSDDAGDGIVVGGVQANAHHPSNPAMTDQNITISNNHVTDVGNRLQGGLRDPVHLRDRRDDHPQPGRPPALRRHRHRLGLGHQRPRRQPGLRQPGHLQLPADLHHAHAR